MVVPVVDVGQVFVLVRDREVAVASSGEDDDRVGSVVRIGCVDRVGVLEAVMSVAVCVVAAGDDEDSRK